MKKQKLPAFLRNPAPAAVTHEFKRHRFMVWATTGPPKFVPLSENAWAVTIPNDGGPRGLEWVRFQAENMREFLDARGLGDSVGRLAEKGYGPLSNEALAARLLLAAKIVLSENMPLETRLDYAVSFGRLETQLSVLLSADDNMPKPPESREKPWAKALARDLLREMPDATDKERWRSIPAEAKDDREVYVGKQRWYVSRGEHHPKNKRPIECLWAVLADNENPVRERGPGLRAFCENYLAQVRRGACG